MWLSAVLENRWSPFVSIPWVQENLVSCEVEGSVAEVPRRFQRVHMDEMAIGAVEAIARRRAEMNALESDRQACILLRIVYIR